MGANIKVEKCELLSELEECVENVYEPDRQFTPEEYGAIIKSFVETLPELEMKIFIRRYYHAEDTKTIAKRYFTNPANVERILSQVREKLRTHLEKEGCLG